MDDRKKESQKTVVAFVAGLLIGGLLVWVFAQTPENDVRADRDKDTVGATDTRDEENGEDTEDRNGADEGEDEEVGATTPTTPSRNQTLQPTIVEGNFSFSIADQEAGTSVVLGDTTRYPTTQGWIVVHEDSNGERGNALGAARYNTAAGLLPTRIVLLRGTQAGKTYHVVYYSEDGDRVFDLGRDKPLESEGRVIQASFKAQ